MKSGKQRRAEITAQRRKRAQKKRLLETGALRTVASVSTSPCNVSLLAPNHSCSDTPFMQRGYYCGVPFKCKDCGKEEIWTATQQKWWYEVAKGDVWSTAVRCRPCRRKERDRRNEARATHMKGLAAKETT